MSYRIKFLPFETTVAVAAGSTILDAVKKANLPLKTSCGGKGTCGDCVVQILSGSYQSKSSAVVSQALASQGYVLACVAKVHDHLTVQLPKFENLSIKSIDSSKFFEDHKHELTGYYEIDPSIKKIDLVLPQPTLDDNYSDLKRLDRELQKKLSTESIQYEYAVIQKLAQVVREKQGHITVILFHHDQNCIVTDIVSNVESKPIYGVACDIGTTTVALNLVNLENGEILSTMSSYNQQLKCGEDIISRINYAQKPDRLLELHDLIIMTINQLIEKAYEAVLLSPENIYYLSMTGNTTMIHLLLHLDPRYIREAPYVPTLNQVPIISAKDVGLKVNPAAKIHCAPSVGSYVGGDITAGLLCTPMLRDSDKISLFIDIGTNGELVVGNKDWLMTCACSAGPAFEGGGIKCGIPATTGAIERIKIRGDGKLDYRVIGNGKPKGVCGSGLIDLLAELLIHGNIDRYGKFQDQTKLIQHETGTGLLIESGQKSFWGRDLILTENDISTLIRTKGAVFSACSLLLKSVGLTFDQIAAFYIAGGFGQHLNIENAIRIGLLPDLERAKFHYLGNSSLIGAYLILLSNRNKKLVNDIANKMTYVELNTEPSYMNEYTGALFLPHTNLDLFPSVHPLGRD